MKVCSENQMCKTSTNVTAINKFVLKLSTLVKHPKTSTSPHPYYLPWPTSNFITCTPIDPLKGMKKGWSRENKAVLNIERFIHSANKRLWLWMRTRESSLFQVFCLGFVWNFCREGKKTFKSPQKAIAKFRIWPYLQSWVVFDIRRVKDILQFEMAISMSE